MKKETYAITLVRPAGISVPQMKAYIKTAVTGWAGGGDPTSPLFGLYGKVGRTPEVARLDTDNTLQILPQHRTLVRMWLERARDTFRGQADPHATESMREAWRINGDYLDSLAKQLKG